MKTVQNYNLPIKMAIMNDSRVSMVQAWENLFFKERYAATDLLQNPNYCELASAYGIKSVSVDCEDDLDETIEYFLNYDGPILCDFKVKSDLCLPLVSPGAALDDIILHDNIKSINTTNIELHSLFIFCLNY